MVILIHTSQAVTGLSWPIESLANYGQMGVQLFFLVSAYTLCLSWRRRADEKENRLGNFYVRRFFRIAPVYWIGIALYAIVSIAHSMYVSGIPSIAEQYTTANVLANVMLLNGLYPPANNCIVPGGWSIGTEVAFYAVFPVAFAIVSRLSIDSLSRGFAVVLGWFFVVQLLLLLLFLFSGTITANNTFLYYSLLVQSQVFILGMVFFELDQKKALMLNNLAGNLAGFFSFTTISFVLWSLEIPHMFAIIPLTSGMSFVFLFSFLRQQAIFNSRLLCRIGTLSYSMYLFHFIFAHYLSKLVSGKLRSLIGSDLTLLVLLISTTAFTAAVAVFAEKWIEAKCVTFGKRFTRRHPNVLVKSNS